MAKSSRQKDQKGPEVGRTLKWLRNQRCFVQVRGGDGLDYGDASQGRER